MQICVDLTNLNKAIRREHYPSPQLDDLTHRLQGADIKLDAMDGCWNIKLTESSSYLTTSNTPWGAEPIHCPGLWFEDVTGSLSKEKPELAIGRCVRLLDLKRKVWERVTIIGIANTPRSYIVQCLEGGIPLRVNRIRIHIKTTKEGWNPSSPTNHVRIEILLKRGSGIHTSCQPT